MNATARLEKDLETIRVAAAFYCEEGISGNKRQQNALDASWRRIRDLAYAGLPKPAKPSKPAKRKCQTCCKPTPVEELKDLSGICSTCAGHISDESFLADEGGNPEA